MAKYLIVNADNLGICQETNAAIERLAQAGRITSSSLTVVGEGFIDAVKRLEQLKHIGVGLHVELPIDYDKRNLLSEKPQNMYEKAESIRAMKEIAAQFEKGKNHGIAFDHLNSNCDSLEEERRVDCLPVCLHFCATNGLPFRYAIRHQEELFENFLKTDNKPAQKAQYQVARFAQQKDVDMPEQILSYHAPIQELTTYQGLKEYYLHLLKNLPDGVSELYVQPASEKSKFFEDTIEWKKCIWDYEFLMDTDFLKVIQEENIKLVTWREAFKK